MNHFRVKILVCIILQLTVRPGIYNGQSPGAIAAGIKVWLRSDNGISSSGATVTQWQELSGANVTGNFTVQPLTGTVNVQSGPTFINAGINFNPYLSFNGSSNSLSSLNSFFGTSLVSNSNVTVFQVLNLKSGIVWLKWETDQVGSVGRFGFENAGGRIRFDFPKAVPATAGQNIGITNVLNKHSLSTTYADAVESVNRLNGANDNTIPIPGPGDFSGTSTKLVIGNEDLINLPCESDLAEIIIYASTLNAAERNKIEYYLAVKYGFTLNQAAANANNYTATDGSITWDRALNSGYASDITGIGRDDATALLQKQSISVNPSALITLYNGAYPSGVFPAENALNTNNFSNNLSFLLVGDNGGTTTINQCAYNGTAQRMQRIWKVSRTGVSFTQTISVNDAAVPAVVKNIMVSADPAFPRASTTLYPLTTANGKRFSEVTLNHNDYFTFTTDTLDVTLTITQPSCTNPNGGNVSTTVTGGNPPITYSWNPSGQVTANLVNVAAGGYTLTITQGICTSTQQVTLTAPAVPAAPAINPVTVCTGNTATLGIQSPNAGYIYNWYNVSTGGSILSTGTTFTSPAVTTATTWYAEAVNGNCASIRTAVLVSINNVAAPTVPGTTICTGNSSTLTVQSPLAGNTDNWYASASGGTLLASGTTFTTTTLSANTSFYIEATNAGCSSVRTQTDVVINTVADPVASAVSVCAGTTALLQIVNPDAANTYNWYTNATGGTALATGVSFTTPAISTNTTYYAEASNAGCSSTRVPVTVSIFPPLPVPVVTSSGITAQSVTFNWQQVAGASGYEISVDGGPFITPSSGSAGLYHIVSGLSQSQTVTIEVIAIPAEQGCPNSDAGKATAKTGSDGFYVPTAFTPNGDVYNNILRPVLPSSALLEYFNVYDRWGIRVFSTQVIVAGWDGKFKKQEES